MYIIVTDNVELLNAAKEKGAQIMKINAETCNSSEKQKKRSPEDIAIELLNGLMIPKTCKGYTYLKDIFEKVIRLNSDDIEYKDLVNCTARLYNINLTDVYAANSAAINAAYNANPSNPLYQRIYGAFNGSISGNAFVSACIRYIISNRCFGYYD